jgi:hypothetical protein
MYFEKDFNEFTCYYHYLARYTCLPEFFDAKCYEQNHKSDIMHSPYTGRMNSNEWGYIYVAYGSAEGHNPTCIPNDFNLGCYALRYPSLKQRFGNDEQKYKAHYLESVKAGKKDNPRCEGCTARTVSNACTANRDRISCLKATESRKRTDSDVQIYGSECVWCPNGPCTGASNNRCEPSIWLDKRAHSGYEPCDGNQIKEPY